MRERRRSDSEGDEEEEADEEDDEEESDDGDEERDDDEDDDDGEDDEDEELSVSDGEDEDDEDGEDGDELDEEVDADGSDDEEDEPRLRFLRLPSLLRRCSLFCSFSLISRCFRSNSSRLAFSSLAAISSGGRSDTEDDDGIDAEPVRIARADGRDE